MKAEKISQWALIKKSLTHSLIWLRNSTLKVGVEVNVWRVRNKIRTSFGHLTLRCSALSWHKVAETVLAPDSQTSAQTTAAKPVLKWVFYKQSCSDCWTCPEMFSSGNRRPNDALLQPMDKRFEFSTCRFEHIQRRKRMRKQMFLIVSKKIIL